MIPSIRPGSGVARGKKERERKKEYYARRENVKKE